jgi:hypothetical protein
LPLDPAKLYAHLEQFAQQTLSSKGGVRSLEERASLASLGDKGTFTTHFLPQSVDLESTHEHIAEYLRLRKDNGTRGELLIAAASPGVGKTHVMDSLALRDTECKTLRTELRHVIVLPVSFNSQTPFADENKSALACRAAFAHFCTATTQFALWQSKWQPRKDLQGLTLLWLTKAIFSKYHSMCPQATANTVGEKAVRVLVIVDEISSVPEEFRYRIMSQIKQTIDTNTNIVVGVFLTSLDPKLINASVFADKSDGDSKNPLKWVTLPRLVDDEAIHALHARLGHHVADENLVRLLTYAAGGHARTLEKVTEALEDAPQDEARTWSGTYQVARQYVWQWYSNKYANRDAGAVIAHSLLQHAFHSSDMVPGTTSTFGRLASTGISINSLDATVAAAPRVSLFGMQMWADSIVKDSIVKDSIVKEEKKHEPARYSPWVALATSLQNALGVSLCLDGKHMELFHAHWECARRCAALVQSLDFPGLEVSVGRCNESRSAKPFSLHSIYHQQGQWYVPESAPELLPALTNTRAFTGTKLTQSMWDDDYNRNAHVLFPKSSQHPGSDMIVLDRAEDGKLHVTFVEVKYSDPDASTTTYKATVKDKIEKTITAYEWMWSGHSSPVPSSSHVAFVFAAFRNVGDICPKVLAAETGFGGTIGVLGRKALQSVYGDLLMPLVQETSSDQRSALWSRIV